MMKLLEITDNGTSIYNSDFVNSCDVLSYTKGSTNQWSDTNNWSEKRHPTSQDDIEINGTCILSMDTNQTAKDVTIKNGELRIIDDSNLKSESVTISDADGKLIIKQESNETPNLKTDSFTNNGGTYKFHAWVKATNTTAPITNKVSLIASPVSGETVANVLTNNSNILKHSDLALNTTQVLFGTYNFSENSYTNFITSTTDGLNVGQGYRVALKDNDGELILKGDLVVDDVTLSSLTNNAFNLVGNPFTTWDLVTNGFVSTISQLRSA